MIKLLTMLRHCAPTAPGPSIRALRTSTEGNGGKYVGAHISASGGCLRALENAAKHLGPRAGAFAFFIRPRLSWRVAAPITDDIAEAFRAGLAASGQFEPAQVVVHGSYIANFGSHDAELRRKSIELVVEEVSRCQQLGVPWYVFHPGSCTRVPPELQWLAPKKKMKTKKETKSKKRKIASGTAAETAEAMVVVNTEDNDDDPDAVEWDREQRRREQEARAMSLAFVGECMAEVLDRTKDVTLLVENMSGQGNVLGRDLRELRVILDNAATAATTTTPLDGSDQGHGQRRDRLGICLDTCHAHASGIPMQSAEDCDAMMQSFYETLGPEWSHALRVLHVNDSMDACGSGRDRHENVGFGRIGLEAFQWLMNNPAFDGLPLILETPRRGRRLGDRLDEVTCATHRQVLKDMEDTDASEIELLLSLVKK